MDASAVVSPPHLAGPLRLRPFRAHLLQPPRVGDPAAGRLLARPYRAVADRLQEWQDRGQVSVDSGPAVYLHEYTSDGVTVRGLVGSLDLRHRAPELKDNVVLPHEGVHPAQVDELAARIEEMQLQPAPILLVHRGSPRLRSLMAAIQETPPGRQFVDAAGQHHRLWTLREPDQLAELDAALATTRALIADGHHRYAAYLRMQTHRPGSPADHGLAMLVDHLDTPFRLEAIHRVLSGVRLEDVRTALAALAIPVEFRPGPSLRDIDPSTIVLFGGGRWALARLPATASSAVELVHDVILPALPRRPRGTDTLPAPEDAVSAARRRRGTALLLPPPSLEQVLAAAGAGRLLPEKATSFQPKPSMGVLMRSLHDG